ncbi:Serine/threonine protein kinase, partial [Giardia duodenalis]
VRQAIAAPLDALCGSAGLLVCPVQCLDGGSSPGTSRGMDEPVDGMGCSRASSVRPRRLAWWGTGDCTVPVVSCAAPGGPWLWSAVYHP